MKRSLKTILALVLALAMVIGTTLQVMAETVTVPVIVENGTETSPGGALDNTNTLNGDLKVEGEGTLDALGVFSDDKDISSDATVTGSVEITADNPTGVHAGAGPEGSIDEGSASVNVDGSITSTGSSKAEGIFAKTYVGDVSVSVGDSVTATSSSESRAQAVGIDVMAYGEYDGDGTGTVNVTVGGDVTATAESEGYSYAQGLDVTTDYGGSATVTVDGKVTASAVGTDEPRWPCRAYSIEGSADKGSTLSVTVGNGAVGQIEFDATNESTASLTIKDGGVTASDPNFSSNFMSSSAVGTRNITSTMQIDITGGITTNGTGFTNTTTTQSRSLVPPEDPSARTTIRLEGDILVDGESEHSDSHFTEGAAGINLSVSGEGAETDFTMDGSVQVTGEENGYADGVHIRNYGASLTAELTGDVTVSGDSSTGVFVNATSIQEMRISEDDIDTEHPYEGDRSELKLESSINLVDKESGETIPPYFMLLSGGSGSDKQYYLLVYTSPNHDIYPLTGVEPEVTTAATTGLTVAGDVTGESYGVTVSADSGTKTDIVIDGTVKGGEGSLVLVNDTELGSGVTLTVWAVEPNDGVVVYSADDSLRSNGQYPQAAEGDGAEGPVLTQNKAAEAQLQYIIRVNAEQTDMITAGGAAQEYSAQGKTYKVAHEGETVTLKLNIPDGYEVVEAYSDQAQSMKLEKNAKGEYFLTVPRGGAVELSVKLNKLPDPEPEPEPEPEANTVMITYILGNGTEYDHIRTTAAVGEGVTLHPAPEREGYTFLYWQCTDVNPGTPNYKEPDPESDFLFRPGAIYTAKKDINFVAVWKKN